MSWSVAFSAFVTDRAGARCSAGSINDRHSINEYDEKIDHGDDYQRYLGRDGLIKLFQEMRRP
jgi:hypothetical protein